MATMVREKFDICDFQAWIRQFECCALTKLWSAEKKVVKFPALLRGVAATHFYALSNDQSYSCDTLIRNLKDALCPAVCRELFYADFSNRLLHDKEDTTVFLHSLRELLEKADPIHTSYFIFEFIKEGEPSA